MLIDAASLIYRAFFSTPETVTAPDGMPVNAAYGFLNMLARLVADRDPDFLVCCDDVDWRPQWRVDLVPSYKTHRVGVPQPVLDAQMPVIYEVLDAAGVPTAGVAGWEAEDVIGALIPRCPGRVEIVSGDRDLFQLVRDPDVVVLYPLRGVSELSLINERYIERKYGIPGRAYGDYAILRGDTSDGLPGVPGIGEKTAQALINRYGSLSAVVEAAMTGDGTGALGKVRKGLDYVDRATQVVLISDEAPIGEVDMTRPAGEATPELTALAERYGLKSPVERLLSALRR
ncbi:MAG TPA: 5'-3' exonuclease [Actinomycetota bacterium]|nr:5'-3' exonuclease [Actinomycetota bacterium]